MKRWVLFLGVGFAVLAGCSEAPDRLQTRQPPGTPAVPAIAERVTESVKVIAYYFHGTVRCETCLKIEKQAEQLINSRFAVEVASDQLVFRPVNYDQPENAHFWKDYKLPSPSLVLVRQENGKDREWKLLAQTWDFVPLPPRLDQYIEEEISKFLQALK